MRNYTTLDLGTIHPMRIALGLSGGVDSAVSAAVLKQQGHEVSAVFLECWREPGCRTDQDRKDALQVALQLQIPFQVLDFKDTYKERVVEYFYREYQAGRTPNPDVLCNKEIKFGLFYDWAMEQGFDAVATGHYATTLTDQSGWHLGTSADEHKDQTYFLYRIRREQLPHIVFPIGHLTKPEVRAKAKQFQLPNATKKDSVGICFIGDVDVRQLLKDRLGENPGQVVTSQGEVIGTHQGLWFYTVGQRHGFQITKPPSAVGGEDLPPLYVLRKNTTENQLVVGFGEETLSDEFELDDLHLIEELEKGSTKLWVRIRHTGQLIPATLYLGEVGERAKVKLDFPVKGIAEGQSAVLYRKVENGWVCSGGGVITTR
jgi:tRNA-specific 2-thiouridylase